MNEQIDLDKWPEGTDRNANAAAPLDGFADLVTTESTLGDELRRIAMDANRNAFEMVREQLCVRARCGHRLVPFYDLEFPPGCEAAVRDWLEREGVTMRRTILRGEFIILPDGVDDGH